MLAIPGLFTLLPFLGQERGARLCFLWNFLWEDQMNTPEEHPLHFLDKWGDAIDDNPGPLGCMAQLLFGLVIAFFPSILLFAILYIVKAFVYLY